MMRRGSLVRFTRTLRVSEDSERAATGSLERDTIHELLIAKRRRYLLDCLSNHGTLPLSDVADEIAYQEHDAPREQIPEENVEAVYQSLWHTHVPKLADANIVSYDEDEDTVALADNADAAIQHISEDTQTEC